MPTCLPDRPCAPQEDQRATLDQQVLEKQKAKVQLQQDKVQDAQDLAAALKQHRSDEAKAAAARRSAALQSKALMAGQVSQACCGSRCADLHQCISYHALQARIAHL